RCRSPQLPSRCRIRPPAGGLELKSMQTESLVRRCVMRRQQMLVGVTVIAVVTLVLAASAQAQDPWLGTWKRNLAKSKYEPTSGAAKSQTVKQEAVAGGGMKSIVDGMDAQGKPLHTEVTTMYDGKSTEVKGAPDANTTRVYKRIDSRTYDF